MSKTLDADRPEPADARPEGESPAPPVPRCELSDRLSTFRTEHRFLRFAEFRTVDEYRALRRWAAEHGLPVYILGNGSNTLFARREVRTVVLRNRLGRTFEQLDGNRLRVSSSIIISQVLKHCQKRRWDSCYYLASVPATIGGALAMNAGRGREHNKSIYDFVESVTFLDGDEVRTLPASEIRREYRWTEFTGVQDRLIIECVMRFPDMPGDADVNAMLERVEWSKERQDHSAPNCGSVFKQCWFPLLRRLRGLTLGGGARFSPKTVNWILNRGKHPKHILRLIRLAQALHTVAGKRAKLELIEVR